MHFVEYRCPNCRSVTLAPAGAMAPGDAGIWQCEQCNFAYQIQIEFREIAPARLQQRREELLSTESGGDDPTRDSAEGAAVEIEDRQRRLRGFNQEIERLGRCRQDLKREAERLQQEIDES